MLMHGKILHDSIRFWNKNTDKNDYIDEDASSALVMKFIGIMYPNDNDIPVFSYLSKV